MPRLRKLRRAEAARRRLRELRAQLMSDPQPPPADSSAGHGGTGTCHKEQQWLVSDLTGHQYRLAVPPPDPDMKNKCSELLKSCFVNLGPVHWRTMECYKVTVILTDQDIQKVSLDGKPERVEELKTQIKEKCKLQYDFSVMFEDPTSGNAFRNLDDVGALPATGATVKVVPLMAGASCAPDDPEVLSPHSSTSSLRQEPWPELFDIPGFSVDVESRLRQANLAYLEDRTYWSLPTDVKHSILDKLAETIHLFDVNPSVERLQSVALALISKHPCLREPGSADGCSDWKYSLKFKMGNCQVGQPTRPGFTEASKEVPYPPDISEGQSEDNLEAERELLVEEMEKRNPSGAVIVSKMDQTFPLRRREIVEVGYLVKTVKERWPALFTQRQVFAEFSRVVTRNLQMDFFEALDRHTPRFVQMFKSKRPSRRMGQTLRALMQQIDAEKADVTAVRTMVLRGLPVLLGDDPNDFYNTCFDCDTDEAWAHVSVGLLTVVREGVQLSPNQLHLHPVSTAIIVDGEVVMDDLQNLPEALCLLFGLSYVLHLNYPEAMANTFTLIQTEMLGL